MEKEKKVRNGNFEVLRIISIIFIIFHHYTLYGNLMAAEGIGLANSLLGKFFYIGGKIGVHIFILISGYFMINSSFKIKKVLKLMLETAFYVVFLEFVYVYVLKQKPAMEIVWRNYWFVNEYITVYALSPFINKLVKSCNKKQVEIMILAMVIISQIYIKGNLFLIVLSYIIGAYIGVYGDEIKKLKSRIWSLIALGNWFVIFALMIILTKWNLKIDYRKFAEIDSIFGMIVAVSMFMCFRGLNIKNNKVIQFVASSSFAVYLLHDNGANRANLWWGIFGCDKVYFLSPLKILAHAGTCIVLIYLVTLCIELVRVNLLEKPIFKIKVFDKYFEKLDKIVNI